MNGSKRRDPNSLNPTAATLGFEAQLWGAANALRGSMDAAEKEAGEYQDVPGFCRSATLEEVRKRGQVLTPGRSVGAEAAPDDGEPFEEKMARLVAQLEEQQAEARRLDDAIAANLALIGYPLLEEERDDRSN